MHGEIAQHAGSDQIVLRLTRKELLLLAGCVNEAIDALEGRDFSARLGADKARAGVLRSELEDLVSQLPPG